MLAALRESLEGHRRKGRAPRLDALSKGELAELARKAEIDGRSSMSKDELIEALEAA